MTVTVAPAYAGLQVDATKPYALAGEVKAALLALGPVRIPFQINQVDLLAGTAQQFMSPVRGRVSGLRVIVQAAVTTGGPITVTANGVTVAGLSATVSNADAAGQVRTGLTITGDGTENVNVGDIITVVPDAAFATAGAVNGWVEITPQGS